MDGAMTLMNPNLLCSARVCVEHGEMRVDFGLGMPTILGMVSTCYVGTVVMGIDLDQTDRHMMTYAKKLPI